MTIIRCPECRSTAVVVMTTLDGTKYHACRACGHEWTTTVPR